MDPSLSLLAVATNRNTLHLYRLAVHAGKPSASAVGCCKAHVAGTAIAKVCSVCGINTWDTRFSWRLL